MTYITYPKYPLVPFQPLSQPVDMVCRKCNTKMTEGIYTKQTLVGGMEDFAGDGYSSTFSAGGTGEVAVCWKCPDCGRSVTKGAT
jgi:rubredoxin